MQKPSIIDLNTQEKSALLEKIQSSNLLSSEKKALEELVQFTLQLQEKLKSSEMTISNLKRLFGCSSESLKKLLQTL
jgi:hypothetical protein